MNNKGAIVIAFLPIILAAIIIFILVTIVSTFFKNMLVAIVLGILGAYLLFNLLPGFDKKENRIGVLIAGLLIISSLFIGVFQPFAIFGDEFRNVGTGSIGSFYAGSNNDYTWVWFKGSGNDITSRSFVASDNLNINIRAQEQKASTEVNSYSLATTYLNGYNYSDLKQVTEFQYQVFIDGQDNGKFGIVQPSVPFYATSGAGANYMNMITGDYYIGYNAVNPCLAYGDTESINLCSSQYVAVSNQAKPEFYKLNMLSKNISELNYDESKLNHDVLIKAVATKFASTTSELKYSGYNFNVFSGKIYIEPKECSDQSNYVTKMFTATSGDIITLNPSFGEIGVPKDAVFCHTLPVLKQTAGVVFEQDYEPYEVLRAGQKVIIPVGQNWIFFYKGSPTDGGYYFCEDNKGIYNSVTNKCEIAPAIEYTCVSGVFNPDTKTCMTQAVEQPICSEGVYNTSTKKCEYFPPIEILCSGESVYNFETKKCEINPVLDNVCLIGVFDSVSNKCVFSPNILNVCSKGTYDELTSNCVYNPEVEIRCLQGTLEGNKCIVNAEPLQGMPFVAIVLVLGTGIIMFVMSYFFLIKKKKRR